jgi:signal transduction histidine kinase
MLKRKDSINGYAAGLNLAECYLMLGLVDSAFIQLDHLSRQEGNLSMQERYWRLKAQAYDKRKNSALALRALMTALALQDSVRMNSESASLARLKTIYELQHKDDSIQQLSLEVKENKEKLSRQNSIVLVTAAFFLFASVFAITYYRLNGKNKAQLQIITGQKNDIDQQKKNIDEQNHKLEAQSELLLKLNLTLQEKNISIEKQKEEISHQNEKLVKVIEDQKNAQSQLIQFEKMAALGQVTAGIAHEINNPLNFISGGVEALTSPIQELISLSRKHNGKPEDGQRIDALEQDAISLLTAVKNGVERSNKIISSLQTFSSPQQSGFSLVRLNDIVEAALTILNTKIKRLQIEITCDVEEKGTVYGNPSQLIQVLINVIDNAIQALEEMNVPRKLDICAKLQANHIELSVVDNGPGIPRDMHEKIFEPFFTTKPVGKGTGLGLAISHSIIKKHNGKISLTSEAGRGTKFVITLPV